jgi:hypothetical protein
VTDGLDQLLSLGFVANVDKSRWPKNRRAARLSLAPGGANEFMILERDDETFDGQLCDRWREVSPLLRRQIGHGECESITRQRDFAGDNLNLPGHHAPQNSRSPTSSAERPTRGLVRPAVFNALIVLDLRRRTERADEVGIVFSIRSGLRGFLGRLGRFGNFGDVELRDLWLE